MNKAVQIRMPQEWHNHLESIAHRRGPGTKVTALIREAIYQTYPMGLREIPKPSEPTKKSKRA